MKDLFLDIEALGLRQGSAIVQLGAVFFDPATGDTAAEFHRHIEPASPFTADLATLAWHREQGTWPPAPREDRLAPVSSAAALDDFAHWLESHAAIGFTSERVWSWGATYDFPLLDPVIEHAFQPARRLWEYWQVMDARTVWNLAFPGIKHAPRPHDALADAIAGAADLCAALAKLRGEEGQPA